MADRTELTEEHEALISDIVWRISNVVDLRDYAVRDPVERAVREAIAALSAPAANDGLIERLMHAVEGECDSLAIDERQARAILEYVFEGAALSAPSGEWMPIVKPLEWSKPQNSNAMNRAGTIVGIYRVWTFAEANGKWFWSLYGVTEGVEANSEQEAKALAWDDYKPRILSALLPSPPALKKEG